MTKYVFVTGGVVSGLGKGITASSIALLLKARGYKVFMQKFDPYFNVDPGTMSPTQHGEVFVTYDGAETDLDLGHYERFIDEELNYTSNITSGKIYSAVISKERKGDYLGATVQMVPHITNEIKNKIYEAAKTSGAEFVITEIGGTVGDIESQSFIEAIRQIQTEQRNNTFFVHTTLVPFICGSNELKTKPTQNSVKDLRNAGIHPDCIILRLPFESSIDLKSKLSLFCNVPLSNIIDAVDVKNIYQTPLNMHKQKIDEIILEKFNLAKNESNIAYWEELVNRIDKLDNVVTIALVGKYIKLHDAYLSVTESLKHAGYQFNSKVNIKWIDSEDIVNEDDIEALFKDINGIIVPGGFGSRGILGKIEAIKYARENNIPFLGICLGMQLAVIEFAKNVCKIEGVSSSEFDIDCENPIIDLMVDQKEILNMGGTLRLGNYQCDLSENTLAKRLYNEDTILERHRHRYEFNNKYRDILTGSGLVISGINQKTNLVEIIELKEHNFFIAAQFHPEFKSRPNKPHPLFLGLIEASINNK